MNERMKTYLKCARTILKQGNCWDVLCDDCPFENSNCIKDRCWRLTRSERRLKLEEFIAKYAVPVHIELEELE